MSFCVFSNNEEVCTTLYVTAQNNLAYSLSCFKMLAMETVCIRKKLDSEIKLILSGLFSG